MDFRDYDTRLAAYCLVVSPAAEVLLALWNEPSEPLWSLPGGGVELDETPAEGAVRELREESGYDVELGALLGIDTHLVPPERRLTPGPRALKSVRVLYEARVVGGSLRREVDGTTDEARWFPLDQVASLARVPLVDTGIGMWRQSRA